MKDMLGISNKVILFFLSLTFTPGNLQSQTFSVFHDFVSTGELSSSTAGIEPRGDLVLSNGVLYGTTPVDGLHGYGSIYSINTDGMGFNVLYGFSNSASGNLTLIGDTLYTTTAVGVINNNGAICSVSTNGTNPKVLYQFTGSGNGAWPTVLISGSNILYGTTLFGNVGNSFTPSGGGVLYSINASDTNFTLLHTFNPMQGGQSLILKDNTLYGTTSYSSSAATNSIIFSIGAGGNDFTNLYTFTNGMSALNLIFSQGQLYGIGRSNSAAPGGIVFSINANGSNFNVLHVFTNSPNCLILQSNLLFGAAVDGGLHNGGMIFSIKTNGDNYNVLYDFPYTGISAFGGPSGLVLNRSTLLGTTQLGGSNNWGTVFSLNPAPTVQSITQDSGNFNMAWQALNGASYQFQYSTNLPSTNWLNLGGSITATTTNLFISDPITNFQRFYRLIYQP